VKHLKLLRNIFNIKQKDLADKSGICIRELLRIENGEVYPMKDTAVALDTAIEQLIKKRTQEEDLEHGKEIQKQNTN
jgi:transcriptional regulator with XRE-family HTH domain